MLAANKNPWVRVITDVCNTAEPSEYAQPVEYLAFCLPTATKLRYRLYFHTARLTADPALLDSILSWVFKVTTTGFAARLGTAASGLSIQLLESRWRSWLLEAYVLEGSFAGRSADRTLVGVNLRVPVSAGALEQRSGRATHQSSLFEPGGPPIVRSEWSGAGLVCVDSHLAVMGSSEALQAGERAIKLGWLEVGRRPAGTQRDEVPLIDIEIRKGERIPLGMAFAAPKVDGNFSLRVLDLPREDSLQLEFEFAGLTKSSIQNYERRLRAFRRQGARFSAQRGGVHLTWKLAKTSVMQM